MERDNSTHLHSRISFRRYNSKNNTLGVIHVALNEFANINKILGVSKDLIKALGTTARRLVVSWSGVIDLELTATTKSTIHSSKSRGSRRVAVELNITKTLGDAGHSINNNLGAKDAPELLKLSEQPLIINDWVQLTNDKSWLPVSSTALLV